jgi:hypothetical protein
MAGMEGLGRVFDTVPVASGVSISMKNASAVSFVATAASTATTSLTFTAVKVFGGTPANFTPANGFGQTTRWYQNTSNAGAAAWTKQVASWSTNVLTIGATSGYASVVSIFTSQMADLYDYIICTGTNTTVLSAYLHDLTVQRTPANLTILAA